MFFGFSETRNRFSVQCIMGELKNVRRVLQVRGVSNVGEWNRGITPAAGDDSERNRRSERCNKN